MVPMTLFEPLHRTSMSTSPAVPAPAERRVAISGATGLIGSALVDALRAEGWRVQRLVRSAPEVGSGDLQWSPAEGRIDAAALESTDAVVSLAGENVAQRWTPAARRAIRESRVGSTGLLARTLARLQQPPAVLVCASAVGYYGDRGDEVLDESSAAGTGFLAEVVQAWEEAARPAVEAGVRVVSLRFGVVLAPSGGALGKLLPLFRRGLGGPIGGGRQWMSWIALDDAIAAIRFALEERELRGALNAVAPEPVTNAHFTHALGHALHRPALVPVPATALRLLYGEMAEETLLASQRVLPKALQRAGFHFRYPTLESALEAVLAPPGA